LNTRTYRPADRPYLRNICKETAWADYKNDPSKSESVCILYNDYFTKYEPENIFVAADDNDIPVGYIICSSDYEKFVRIYKSEIRNELFRTAPLELWQLYLFLFCLKKIKDTAVICTLIFCLNISIWGSEKILWIH
jgi:hypothetical protein